MSTLERAIEPLGAAVNREAALRRQVAKAFLYLVMVLLGVMFMFPYVWTVLSSLKATHELYTWPPVLFPTRPLWQNYATVFDLHPFGNWMLNTLRLTALTVLGTTISAVPVAYAFARFKWPGRDLVFTLTLATMMLPYEVTLIPLYLMFIRIGWHDTLLPMWVPAWFGGGAFTIFLLREFIRTIPIDLDEAALIDGAGYLRILTTIIVPLMKPALATALVIVVVSIWGDFLRPLIYLNSPDKFPIALGLRFFDQWGQTTAQGLPQDHYLMAACIMSTAPILVLFFSFQRYFVQGIVMTGIKG